MNYEITEQSKREGKAGYNVASPPRQLAEFVSYERARYLVEKRLRPGDTVTEVYLAGPTAEYTAEAFIASQEDIRQNHDC